MSQPTQFSRLGPQNWSTDTIATVVFWAIVLFIEALLVIVYLQVSGDRIQSIRYTVIYPFLWINLGLWTVFRTRPLPASRQTQLIAGAIASAYFILLLAIPGKLALTGETTGAGLTYRWQIPGWGPIVSYDGAVLRATLIPYEVVGYSALSYLVYQHVLRLSRFSLAGLAGIVTCVGCTIPVLVPLIGVLGGAGTAIAAQAFNWAYDIGTVLYVLIVVLFVRSLSHR